MRLETRVIQAEDCPVDVFVFMPKQNRFFFVDHIDIGERYTTLYFEPTADPSDWVDIRFRNEEKIKIISYYSINLK